MSNNSVWRTEGEPPKRKILFGNIETEVAVIGGGLAGILIADRLQRAGKRAVVIEASKIASGQTKNTTAKITAQHGAIYADLIKYFGKSKALQYFKANSDAVEWYAKCVKERKIDCDFEEKSAYIYSVKNEERLKAEAKACRSLGANAKFTYKTDLPFETAAVKMEAQAQFNPLKFINAIAKELTVYEHSLVKSVDQNTIFCENGRVEAESIVFACHYPFINFPGLYFAKMYQQRSYVIALENTPHIEGMYLGIDKEGFSLRGYKDLLIFGGGQHRAGENSLGGKYALLRRGARDMFGDYREIACWSAQDCVTADGLPYIGEFSATKPSWFVATGFGKWGMTSSAVAAKIITDLICRKNSSDAEVFLPSRCSLKACKGISSEVIQSAKGLIRQKLVIPNEKLTGISVGHGGIVRLDGKRVGVYRESERKYYCVDTKCPHLGCSLEWNPDEKSWDCPCHGSRFSFKGELIDNPAQENIDCELRDLG